MPRGGRRGAHRGKPRRGLSRGLEKSFVASGSSTTQKGRTGLTLAEEALNTERRESHWDSNYPLRYSKVTFVSAGNISQPDAKAAESALADMSLNSPLDLQNGFGAELKDTSNEKFEETAAPTSSIYQDQLTSTDTPNFIIDTLGEKSINTKLPSPQFRSNSPTPSNSSEEVILFGGRNNLGKAISRSTRSSEQASLADPFDAKIKIVEEKIHLQEKLLQDALHQKSNACKELMTKQSTSSKYSDGFELLLRGHRSRGRNHGRGQCQVRQSSDKAAEHEAVLADYLANMDSEDKEGLIQPSAFKTRDLGGTDDEAWQNETELSSGEPHISEEHLKGGWDDSNIEDLGDLSTSEGVMGEVQAIFSKRERKSGLQYLVVWGGQTMDDATWVPEQTLKSDNAQAHIESFEAEAKVVPQIAVASDEDDDDDINDSIDGEDTADEDTEDDEDLLQRKIDRMTDEQIAKLLAKEEELGMDPSELLLLGDAADVDEEDEYALPDRSFNAFMLSSDKKSRSKRPRGEFPAATALADAYDGFDVMDFERPSLKRKPKGRKGKLVLDDVDDSELEEAMQSAWFNDRVKKKERKQERELLRARGLLGNKNGKVDMKQKYKEGMGMQAIKDEIKRFLIGSNATLSLPPMDKAHRKIVHEIANAFKLKSKSAGDGNSRFPILYRTSRTSAYIERTWRQVEARLDRNFLPRSDVGHKKKPARGGGGGGGGFNRTAVSYQDGDVVGGSAPELGAENRGRAMLEKMGWSQGTALGALNNKGILQPVSHVVKTTKAGLG